MPHMSVVSRQRKQKFLQKLECIKVDLHLFFQRNEKKFRAKISVNFEQNSCNVLQSLFIQT